VVVELRVRLGAAPGTDGAARGTEPGWR
jgi:hypothetical protein